ncbi:glutamate racemase [Ramlibacter sp.]|uniref:glutamate racemase n=1 Tax=Ramlibacter sp. TaxID=1917967 RepID=UPI0018182056|nr:glutamate racemase [Ramlibacter sp.]MBA2674314.1 glutamate racemase [Ramlibacter sp.]
MQPGSPIGVFDSGIGGLSILRSLRAELPNEDFVYFSDAGHAPYGERDDAFVAQRSAGIARTLVDGHRIKALVVACNTATAAAVHLLRETHGQALPVVGVEPALRPAATLTRTRRVAVFATRGTLASAKFRALHDSMSAHAEFLLQPCDGLATAIESHDADAVAALCERYARACGAFGGTQGQIDTLVLGCTHYPFALAQLTAAVGPAVHLLENGAPVARQTRRLLEDNALLNAQGAGRVTLLTTGAPQALRAASQRWLGLQAEAVPA